MASKTETASTQRPPPQPAPWWGNLILYAGVVIGVVWLIGTVISSILQGPLNTYKAMWDTQFTELITKIDAYTKEDGGNLTPAHQTAIDEEVKVLDLTYKGMADAAGALYNLLAWTAGEIIAACAAVGITYVIVNAWLKKAAGQWGTSHGATYIALMSMADNLAVAGQTTEATALATSAQTMFTSLDLPYMESTITALQAELPTLTGVELLVAQQTIAALTVEITAIPIILATPLPIPL
jgi:hypothetical protein